MKKGLLIVLIVILCALSATGAYYFASRDKNDGIIDNNQEENNNIENNVEEENNTTEDNKEESNTNQNENINDKNQIDNNKNEVKQEYVKVTIDSFTYEFLEDKIKVTADTTESKNNYYYITGYEGIIKEYVSMEACDSPSVDLQSLTILTTKGLYSMANTQIYDQAKEGFPFKKEFKMTKITDGSNIKSIKYYNNEKETWCDKEKDENCMCYEDGCLTYEYTNSSCILNFPMVEYIDGSTKILNIKADFDNNTAFFELVKPEKNPYLK